MKSKDQVLGKTQAAGLNPSVNGIASRRIAGLTSRAIGVADAVHTLLAARDSGDPALAAIAAKLLENKEFIRSMIAAVEEIKASIKPAAAAPAAATPPAEPNSDDTYAANEAPSSNLPGTDSAAAPGTYTVDDLNRDLAMQRAATIRIAAKSGMDAAIAQVNASPLMPAWDSNVWSVDARQRMRDRAWSDGAAAAYLAKYGDGPGLRDTTAAEDTESAIRRLEGQR